MRNITFFKFADTKGYISLPIIGTRLKFCYYKTCKEPLLFNKYETEYVDIKKYYI